MRIIEQSWSFEDRSDPVKLIERAGRTCYKSEDKIGEGTAEEFIKRIMVAGHRTVIEHATASMELPAPASANPIRTTIPAATSLLTLPPQDTAFIRYTTAHILPMPDGKPTSGIIVSGNFRAWLELLEKYPTHAFAQAIGPYLQKLCPAVFCWVPAYEETAESRAIRPGRPVELEEWWLHLYETVRLVTDRGVTHELVRHRPMTFSQESTRYANYGTARFGGEITVIKPERFTGYTSENSGFLRWIERQQAAEDAYLAALKEGDRAQEARDHLTNSTKAEIVVTANLAEWRHVFKLRCDKAAHPQMQALMKSVLAGFAIKYAPLFDDLAEKFLGAA